MWPTFGRSIISMASPAAANHFKQSNMSLRLFWTCLLALLCTLGFAQQTPSGTPRLSEALTPVRFHFGAVQFPENFAPGKHGQPLQAEELAAGHYARFMQCGRLLSTAERRALEGAGLRFLEYVPNAAYLVLVPQSFELRQLEAYPVRSLVSVQPDWKIGKTLRNRPLPGWAMNGAKVAIQATFYPQMTAGDVQALCATLGYPCQPVAEKNLLFALELPEADIARFAAQPFVRFLGLTPPPAEPEDTRGRALHRGNVIDGESPLSKKYNGTGIGVIVRDDGQIGPHIDFQGRIAGQTETPPEEGGHGDGVAGILAGAGNLDPSKKGMAAGATLFVVDYGSEFQDDATLLPIVDGLATITNSSYGDGCNSGYTFSAEITDQQIFELPALMHVFSAGNSGTSDCGSNNYGAGAGWGNITGGHKQGKNSIATANLNQEGALANSSSRGPAYDGRIKPDIAANGNGHTTTGMDNGYITFSGTSGAAPGVAGLLAQLSQAFKTLQNGPEPPAALLKATILNSANDLGNPGPDFKFGWGHLNGGRALTTLEQNQWSENALDNNGLQSSTLAVPPGLRQLRVMLYWAEGAGSPMSAQALINDLDLTLQGPGGTLHRPWVLDHRPDPALLDAPATQGRDSLNNMEQVAIDNPAPGNYTIRVRGAAVPQGPQDYFLVWSFLADDVALTYPNGGEGFVPGETERLHWDALGNTEGFDLQYSTNNGASWQPLATVAPDQRSYDWTVPNTVSGQVRVRLSRAAQEDENDHPFSIVGVPSDIQLRVCPDSVTVLWTPVGDTLRYEVFQLGEKYMELIGSTSNNFFKYPTQDFAAGRWVSVRCSHPNGLTGRRAVAVFHPGGEGSCPLPDDIALLQALSFDESGVVACGPAERAVRVRVENKGLSNISDAKLFYQIDNQTPVMQGLPPLPVNTTFDFEFSTPAQFAVSGQVQLRIWAEFSPDDNKANDTLSLSLPVVVDAATAVFNEGLQAGDALPSGWSIVNPDELFGWELREGLSGPIIGSDGLPTRAFFLDCFSYENRGQEDYIYVIPLDLQNFSTPTLAFDLAHAMYNNSYAETLRVDIFPDCNPESEPTTIWDKMDPELATTNPTTSEFVPNEASDWRAEVIDLSAYAGQSILVRFTAVNDFGNSIFLDNISLLDSPLEAPEAVITTDVDTICRFDTVFFAAQPSGVGLTPTQYRWSFGQGALPAVAQGIGPHLVSYVGPEGNKTVRLIANNSIGADTTTLDLFVKPLPSGLFTFTSDQLTVNFSSSGTNVDSYLWDFGDGTTSTEPNPVHTYPAPGEYTVRLSLVNECATALRLSNLTLTSSTSGAFASSVDILVSPNPNSGAFDLRLSGLRPGPVQLQLLDALGRALHTRTATIVAQEQVLRFEDLNLPKGVYQLRIQTEKGTLTTPVVVQGK
jgi:PKD repeat protein